MAILTAESGVFIAYAVAALFLAMIAYSTLGSGARVYLSRLIERAAIKLPPEDQARYLEEWQSHFAATPGNLTALFHVLGCLYGARKLGRELAEFRRDSERKSLRRAAILRASGSTGSARSCGRATEGAHGRLRAGVDTIDHR